MGPTPPEPIQGLGRLLEALDHGRARLPSWQIRLLAMLLLAAVFALDLLVGPPVAMSLLYGLVVVGMAWAEGVSGVAWCTASAALLDLVADLVGGREIGSREVINEALRALLWLFMGSGAVLLRDRIHQVEEQRRELQRAYARVREDVDAAERVQHAFLDRSLPADPRVEMELRRLVARGLSGDFWEVRREGDRLVVLVADVSGKGPPAALGTALLRGALAEARHDHAEPAEVLALLNDALEPHLPPGMFVTCFYGCLDLESGELSYASAGHDPALLRRPAGLERLGNTGVPLGIVGGELWEQGSRRLQPGDLLLVYTDGLVDSRGPDGQRLDLEGLERAMGQGPPAAPALADALERLVVEREGPRPRDDVIILALSWVGPPVRRHGPA